MYEHLIASLDGSRSAFDSNEGIDRSGERRVVIDSALAPAGTSGSTRRSIRFVREQVKQYRPDVLLTYGWGAFDAVIARALGLISVPCIHHEDGFTATEIESIPRRRDWARRRCLRRIEGTLVPSTTLARIAGERWNVPFRRMQHVPNGVAEWSASGAADVRTRLSLPAGRPVAVVLGRLARVKRVDIAIQAAARAEIQLVVVGDGPERANLEQLARTQAATIRFVGESDRARDWLVGADLYLSTSSSEQHPLAMLEAMDAGLPVVATDVGDVALSLPKRQAPFLCAASDPPDAFAESIRRLLSDAEVARSIGSENRSLVAARFRMSETARRYESAIDRFVQAH